MGYVSVGQIENLEEAIAGIIQIAAQAHELSVINELKMQRLLEVANEAYANGSQLLQETMQAEAEACTSVEQTVSVCTDAQTVLQEAASDLSVCRASVYYDEDGNCVVPDCSCEETCYEQAEVEADEAAQQLEEAQQQYEQTKELRMLRERQREQFAICVQQAQQLQEAVTTLYKTSAQQIAENAEVGRMRLQHAKYALQEYLAANPEAARFYEWLHWTPQPDKPVTPDIINSRLTLDQEQLRFFFEYLTERNPAFREKIAQYRAELNNANGDAERGEILLKVRRNLSGAFAEHIVEQAFKPLGARVTTQRRTDFADGSYTKTDIVIEDLKTAVILGKGKGMAAQKGGSIAIEVKCGKASYLYNQKDHMVYQAGGHQDSDASVVICSRDIKDLSPEKEQEVRNALREAGSPIAGMLPWKEEIDEICWDEIQNDTEKRKKKGKKEHDKH